MKSIKTALATLAVCSIALTPVQAFAEDDAADTAGGIISGVGCGIVTIVTLPILILGGEQPSCG